MRINHVYDSNTLEGFACQCCGACCRIPGGIVRLSDAEIARIAAYLDMSEDDFIAQETEVSPDRKCLILKDSPDGTGACGMLDAEGRCRIHLVKPDQCASFPYDWANDNSTTYCPALRALC